MTLSSDSLSTCLTARFRGIPRDRILFVGVGNRMRGDDAIGPLLLDGLQGHAGHLLDVGATPEEYTGVIKRHNPRIIVFLDALDFEAAPGQVKIAEIEEIAGIANSVHKISLDILMEYLKEETGADVFLIGIQYSRISYASELTPEVAEAIQECIQGITRALSDIN